MKRILVFSPYARLAFHTNYETTIARGCQLRGAEVKYVLCDALFAECDIHHGAMSGAGRPFDLCIGCQSDATAILDSAGLSYDWLGQYVEEPERRAAAEWAQQLRPDELATARYNGHPVGEWIVSSIASYFRVHEIDRTDWATTNVTRGFLQAAAVSVIGLERIMDIWRPDALLVFNGRWSVLRVAFNLAKKRGVRVLVHERGQAPGAVMVVENANCLSTAPFAEYWRKWSDVPLTENQFHSVVRWITDRRYQRNASDLTFATLPEGDDQLATRMGLARGRKLIVLFTSSTDEYLGEPDCPSYFDSQENWIERVVAWVACRPDCNLIVRAHPCLAGKATFIRSPQMIEWFQALAPHLPANVRLVLPDDALSSYDIMDAADVCLSYGSTAGIEMMALGKPVVIASGIAMYQCVKEVIKMRGEAELESALSCALTLTPARELQRSAFRYIYRFFFGMQTPFALVSMNGPWISALNYKTLEELAPGKDASLDRICDFLLEDAPIFSGPDHARQAATLEAEDALLAALEADPNWCRIKPPKLTASARIKTAIVACVKPAYRAASPLLKSLEKKMQSIERRLEAS